MTSVALFTSLFYCQFNLQMDEKLTARPIPKRYSHSKPSFSQNRNDAMSFRRDHVGRGSIPAAVEGFHYPPDP